MKRNLALTTAALFATLGTAAFAQSNPPLAAYTAGSGQRCPFVI
jgi:hypothetical protein